MAAILSIASSCVGAGRPPQSGATPSASPSPTTASAANSMDQAATLGRAIEKLNQAKSYRISIQAVYHWRTPEGQEYDWTFEGEGAAVGPNRFYSVMRGPADTIYRVKMVDGKITNEDARGQRPEASTAFGGPGVGTAPYTLISYLKSGAPQGQAQVARLNGVETVRLSFSPNLNKVAAMDASHKGLQERVQTVQGSVWIGAQDGRVIQLAATVQSLDSRQLLQTTTITLKLFDFDAAIEIN